MGNDKQAKLKWVRHPVLSRGRSSGKGVAVPDDKNMTITVQKPLGIINYRGPKVTVWAMTDEEGGVVKGGGNAQRAALAKMNEYGEMAIRGVADLGQLERAWRQSVDVVRRATAQSGVDIKKVEAALPAMRERRRKDEDFFRDVNGYLSAMENAEGIVGRIRKAEAGLRRAASTLQSADLWQKANDKENEVKDNEQAVAAKEAEIAEARRLAGEIFDIAEKVLSQDWSGLASKALEFARDKAIDASIDAQFGRDLAELKAKLAKAQSELKTLKIQALASAVEAARHGVNEALIDLENARTDFRTALGQLARLQTNASDTLRKSKSTAGVGEMLARRAKQLHAIDVARAACDRYARMSAMARERMALIINKYSVVGSWLDSAARANAAFDRSQPYAQMLERSALSNAVELGRWDIWTESIQRDCKQSLAWLSDGSAKGPMVHFERAVAVAKEALVDSH